MSPEPHWAGRDKPAGGGDGGGSSTLEGLTDVSGTPEDGHGPVYNDQGVANLIPVVKQEDLDAVLAQVIWHRVPDLTDPWQPSNTTVHSTPDGASFGPYPDGAAAGGSVRYHGLNGQPFSAVRNVVYCIRYTSDTLELQAGAAPYLRVYTQDDQGNPHDAIFTPGSQTYTGLGAGPVQEFVASAGMWRWDDDAGTGGVPLDELQEQYGRQTITRLGITLGYTAGQNLAGLLRWWQINGNAYLFGT